jgi:hypothetical protein
MTREAKPSSVEQSSPEIKRCDQQNRERQPQRTRRDGLAACTQEFCLRISGDDDAEYQRRRRQMSQHVERF